MPTMKKLIIYSISLFLLGVFLYFLFSFHSNKTPAIYEGKLHFLGLKKLDELNLKLQKTHFSENHPRQTKSYYTFLYRDRYIIQSNFPADVLTLASNPSQNWDLYYTLMTIEKIILKYPNLYQTLVLDFFELPFLETYKEEYKPWVNQYEKIIICFTDEMDSISSMITELDENPVRRVLNTKTINIYKNYLIIYFNQKAIHTKNEFIGSYPYYGFNTDEENFHAYMNDGIVCTMLHEFLHGLIWQFNYKNNTVFSAFSENDLFYGDKKKYDQALNDYQEILVIRTLNKYFKDNRVCSPNIIRSSEETEAKIRSEIGEKNLQLYKQKFLNTENFLEDDSLDVIEN